MFRKWDNIVSFATIISEEASAYLDFSVERDKCMIEFSPVISPKTISRGDVFSARQYSRAAFDNLIDPVLNIDWFDMAGPTFPAHPHAGFSAVTYLFADSPNGFNNRDSLGDEHSIKPGGLHWSRASRGIMHEETPLVGGGPVRGLQIFLNLPEAYQQDAAAVFPVAPDEVRIERGDGWTSRTAVDGTVLASVGDALPSPVRIVEVALNGRAVFELVVPAGWGGVLIALEGGLSLNDGTLLQATEAIGFASADGATMSVSANNDSARIAVVMGLQLHQPIHAYGPLMLASPQALEQARAYVTTLSIPSTGPVN